MQYNQFVPYTDRLDYLAPIANNVAYALAVEKLMGWELPPRGKAIRVICCELARISAHMLGIGAMAMDIGAVTVFLYTFLEREKIYNLCRIAERGPFHDELHAHGRPDAGSARDSFISQLRDFLAGCQARHRRAGQASDPKSHLHRSMQGRRRDLEGPRQLPTRSRVPICAVSGVEHDVRRKHPYLDYGNYDFEIPIGSVGDAFDRYLVRMEEMRQSVRILEQVIEKLPAGARSTTSIPSRRCRRRSTCSPRWRNSSTILSLVTEGVDAPVGEVYFGAENPKGELGFYICSKGGGVPYRLKIRSPSFVNLSILPKILPGHMISDVVTILRLLRFRDGRVRSIAGQELGYPGGHFIWRPPST